MKIFCKLYISINFFERNHSYESRSYFIEEIIEDTKESILQHHADTVEISGEMFKTDIKNFIKIIKTKPSSIEPTEKANKYLVTFVIPAKKLLN